MNDVCNSKHKTLNEKKLALKQLSGLTDHCINFVQGALNKGSDMALLSTKKNLTCHLNRIKAMRADIPNPDIPVRIMLNIEKLSELARGIYTLFINIFLCVIYFKKNFQPLVILDRLWSIVNPTCLMDM